MKKSMALLGISILCSVGLYAEIILALGLGFSNHFSSDVSTRTIKTPTGISTTEGLVQGDLSINGLALGFDVHFVHNRSGLSFILGNELTIPLSYTKSGRFLQGDPAILKTRYKMNATPLGFMYDLKLLLGYTYGRNETFSFYVAAGADLGAGIIKLKQRKSYFNTHTITDLLLPGREYHVGIALNLGFRYYFSPTIGLGIDISESFGIGGVFFEGNNRQEEYFATLFDTGLLSNRFTIKLGSIFRL